MSTFGTWKSAGRAQYQETGNQGWEGVLRQAICLEFKHKQKTEAYFKRRVKTLPRKANRLLLADRKTIQKIKSHSNSRVSTK